MLPWLFPLVQPSELDHFDQALLCKQCLAPGPVQARRTTNGDKWRFKVLFAWQAQGFRQVAKYGADAGIREGCKSVGRRGG